VGGRVMSERGARTLMGVWGLCPQLGPGATPLVRGSGGRTPPEADDNLVLDGHFKHSKLHHIQHYLCSQ